MSKTYIVPLDGSTLSEIALPWARRLAELDGARLLLFRAVPLASPREVGQEAAEYLERKVGEFPKGVADSMQSEGEPADAILELSESENAEAVVMASNGRGGLGRWLLGSVATKVLRASRVPVFVVNARTEVAPTPTVKRILVPLDGSEFSEAAIPKALDLAEKFDASVVLYRSILPGGFEYPSMEQAITVPKNAVNRYLATIAARYSDDRVETVSTFDQPHHGIVKQSQECDLIVMGSHGHGGVRRWMLGSVSERIVQEAPRPVLLVYSR